MGTVREPLAEGMEAAPHLGPEQPRVYSDLSFDEKDRYNADIRATNILLQGLPKDIYTLINHYTDTKDIWDNFAKLINNMRNIKMTMSRMQLNSKFVNNMLPEWDNAIDEYVDEQPVQDLALNVDNVFQGDDCDAFDSDVDETPTAQTMFMANLSSTDPVYDEAGPSYDLDILSEVYDHDHSQDVVCEPHDEHEMHDNVQLNHIVDSHANYTCNSNMIPYDQYVKDNAVPEREQKINEQLRLVISDRNFKEETLKKELHSVKLQLASTINHNKLMVEEVTSLKKDFKQKENKYLEYFLDMKSLKENNEDRFFKQDQSLQTVHMLCRPKPYYNELNKVAICYKNPLCLTRAKQVQPALYNGYEIIKDNHVPDIVHKTEDTLETAKITKRKMNDKMKDPECVTHKVKIAPHDYSKENFLATFTP
nr:hypothetical protein [Tanacetum cinerariifolium]